MSSTSWKMASQPVRSPRRELRQLMKTGSKSSPKFTLASSPSSSNSSNGIYNERGRIRDDIFDELDRIRHRRYRHPRGYIEAEDVAGAKDELCAVWQEIMAAFNGKVEIRFVLTNAFLGSLFLQSSMPEGLSLSMISITTGPARALSTPHDSTLNDLEQLRSDGLSLIPVVSKGSSDHADRNIENYARRQETKFNTIFQPSTKPLLVDDQHVQCRRYIYRPLREGEIRLLLLGRSTSRTVEAGIRYSLPTIKLVCVPLNRAPTFRAISYAWGSFHDVVLIHIGKGSFLNTTRNLAQALGNFRLIPGEVHYLWADQLCIDQGNLIERELQVGMMNKIYSKAAKCVAWLGEADDDTLSAFETIKSVKAAGWKLNALPDAPARQRIVQSKTWTAEAASKLPSFEDRSWTTLRSLLDREWFSRLWILQEVVIPRVVYFKCGRYSCTQNELYTAAFYLQQICTDTANPCREGLRRNTAMHVSPSGIESCNIVGRLRCVKQSAIPNQFLSTLLVESRARYQCSDAHDRVYALLGLVSLVEDLNIHVSYTESVASTYTKATKAIIESYRSLRVLGALGDKESKQIAGLPSWTPDWSILGHTVPLQAVSAFDAIHLQMFRASYFHPHKPRFTTDADQLVTAGRVVDRIQDDIHRVCGEQDSLPQDSPLLRSEALLLQCLRLFAKDCRWPAKECGDEFQGEVQALIVQTITATYYLDSTIQKLDNLRRAASEMLDAFAYSLAREETTQERPTELQNWLTQLGEFSEACVSRRIVKLAKYQLGLCPRDCQNGDLVCILHGSNVPILLRPQGQYYEVVGQCYVHEIMQGEAVDWEEDEADLFTLI
ncbi:hypothetical protein MMC18_002525 [Xylographa bjoerkii]|nr:hypothetical protein [Xylographa bjoerkii]